MSESQSTKVLLFSKYSRMGASSRLRSLQYIPSLKGANIQVDVTPLFNDDYLEQLYSGKGRSKGLVLKAYLKRFFTLFKLFKYDLVWIEYELFPYMPAWIERLMVLYGVNYIVDYDDAVFHNYDLSNQYFIRKTLSSKIDRVMASAKCVIVGNDYLKQRAISAGAKQVELIPTVVDGSRYSVAGNDNNVLIIGWIGSPATQYYVVELKPVLERLSKTCEFKLVLVGANVLVIEELKGINVEIVPWQESTEAELISQFDIGIMPLRDGPWEKGKCGYKLIQYMACAKPVVASAIGVNVDIVENSQCGLLANDNDSWFDQLNLLIEDSELRLSAGNKGREAVETIYSLQVQSLKLINIINEAVAV